MIYRIGTGEVVVDGNIIHYNGTFPNCEDGDELVIMHAEDLETLLTNDVEALLVTQKVMDASLFEVRDNTPPFFEDELAYQGADGTLHKLFLDRHFYSPNYKDMVFVRYVSVDQSVMEEGQP